MDTFAPSSKKRKQTPSSSSDVGEKVCIICTSLLAQPTEGCGNDSLHVYVVDLSADGRGGPRVGCRPTFKHPTFTIGRSCLPFIENICVLGSTLYLLDGFNRTNNTGGKSFYSYEFPQDILSLSNFTLQRHMLTKTPDMNSIKGFPISIPTPDKKGILVFSSVIGKDPRCADEACAADFCDPNLDLFELYRPSGYWERFAGIPVSWMISDFMIIDYTFIDNQNVLLLTTDNIGMFTLDLRLPNQPCRRLPSTPPPVPKCGYSILAGGQLFLGRDFACEGDVLTFSYPGLLFPETSCLRTNSEITLLRVDDSECKFCIIQSYTDSVTFCPHLTVNVYKLDLGEYMKRKEEEEYKGRRFYDALPLPATEIVKSFEYSLGTQAFEDSFRLWGLFSTQRGN